MKDAKIVALLIGCLVLAACGPITPAVQPTAVPTFGPTNTAVAAPTTAPTDTAAPAPTAAPTDTSAPAPTDTSAPAPTDTSAPAATVAPATAAPTQASAAPTVGPDPNYIDDRSTPAALMTSYVNALNTHQYLRAYSYWRPGAAQLQPFAQFEAGFANTGSTQLTLGTVTGDAGAGQLYYSVPVKLVTQTTNNSTQTFVGCYVLHLSQPGFQATPPFQGLSIDSATVQQVANNTDTTNQLTHACDANQGGPLPATAVPQPDDISPARYLDDRSDAVQVLRSLFNAVNREEYLRAYSYWEPNAQGLPTFDQFQQGYTNTSSVKLITGTVTGDAGAGQRYYQVPVTLIATTTANATETYVGCYTLHLGLPDAQGVPPYQGIGIRSANIQKVANNANTATLMAQACQ